ncbi:MAG: sensor histidine kinase [Candidatus Planktophila sp.]
MAQSTRVEIAQEIHDGIAQDLVALGYQLDAVLAAPLTPADTRHDLRTIRFCVSDLIEKVRLEIFNLRSTDDFQTHVHEIIREISPDIAVRGLDLEISTEKKSILVRVIPELLRNAVHHAGASDISLSLDAIENRVMVKVCDNGSGGAMAAPGHFGIQGCIERVESVGGSIQFDSGEEGTTVTIWL